MERNIGEIFEYNGEWYQCLGQYTGCPECAFKGKSCDDDIINLRGECISYYRSDRKDVHFKKLEKVGEPITVNGKNVQLLKTTIANCENCAFYKDVNCDFTCYPRKCYGGEEGTYVEIKTKEDMEEYRMYDAKEDIPEFDKVVDECLFCEDKLNLKPFDFEAAKQGKPVCTRNGRKARIICFDAEGEHPIIALVTDGVQESPYNYTKEGYYHTEGVETMADLMMLPEKKEGWINICRNLNTNKTELDTKDIYNTKEEALQNLSSMTYVTTVKIEWDE